MTDQPSTGRRRLRQLLRPYWAFVRRWRWPLLGGCTLIVLVIGAVGFHATPEFRTRPWPESIYASFQLFTLESGVASKHPGTLLQIARVAAASIAIGVGFSALWAIFRGQFDRLRVRFRPRQVVVCGLGSCGTRLAQGFARRGYRVVAIERVDGAVADTCRQSGVVVLIGDATDGTLLRTVRISQAEIAIVVCGEDGLNANVANRIRQEVTQPGARRRTDPLRCFVHIDDEELCAVLSVPPATADDAPQTPVVRMEFFNPSALAAPAS